MNGQDRHRLIAKFANRLLLATTFSGELHGSRNPGVVYYLLSELGLRLGLDALTFGMIFVMAAIGSRLLRVTLDSLLLAILFFPILALSAAVANYFGLAAGFTEQFAVPQDQLGLIRYISAREFITVMLVTFSGMLVGLAGILGMYRVWGHAG